MGLDRVDFFFEDQVVGYFEREAQVTAGEQPYMPYRGLGHLRLGEKLSSGAQQCYFFHDGDKHFFTVRRMVRLHVLEIG